MSKQKHPDNWVDKGWLLRYIHTLSKLGRQGETSAESVLL